MKNENLLNEKNDNENNDKEIKTEQNNIENNEEIKINEEIVIINQENQENLLNMNNNNENKKEFEQLNIQNNDIENINNDNNEINTNIQNRPNLLFNNNSIENYLNDIEIVSKNMDVESYNKAFRERIEKDIDTILLLNLNPSQTEEIKIIFYFLLKYLKIRFNYLKTMLHKEIMYILKIIYCNNRIYVFNNFFQNDFQIMDNYDTLEKNILNPILHELCPNMKEFENSYKKILNSNLLYKYLLEFLYQEKFLNKFYEEILLKPELEMNNFYYYCFILSSLCFYYNKEYLLKDNLVINYIQLMNKRYDNLLSSESKYINKVDAENIFLNKILLDFYLISEIYLDIKEQYFDDIKKLLTKDLDLSYKLLKSNNLEKRVIGIKYLSDLCSYINNTQYYSQFENYKEIIGLKKEYFLEFLYKIDFYNLILGENIHEAILSRASPIFVFLYKNNKLTSEDIVNLCKFYQEKHQSIGESILRVFSELIHVFSNEHSNFVLKIISDMNYKDINDNTLKILENFNLVNIRNENLLRILFKFSNENSYYNGLGINIILKCRNLLCNILLKDEYRNDLVKFVKKCIFGIGCNNIVNTYLYLLNILLTNIKLNDKKEIYQAFNGNIEDYNDLIKYLDTKLTLTSTILYSLIDIKKEILFFSSEIDNIQKNIINRKNDEENILNVNDIMNDYDEHRFNLENDNSNPNNIRINQEVHNQNNNINNNQNQHNNLDLTQSTEKTLEDNMQIDIDNENIDENENSFSSISTDISNIEKTKRIIIQNFIDSYQKELQLKNFSLKDNYDFVFRKLKLNFQGQNYYSFISVLLNFLKGLIFSSSLTLSKQQIEFLYIILVKKRVDEEEENIYYSFFSEIIKYQFLTKSNFLSEDNISYLCLELFCKDESLFNVTYPAFDLIKNFFIYINSIHNNIMFNSNSNRIVSINKFNCLSSFKTIWKIYLLTTNNKISDESLFLLNNIISIVSENIDDRKILFDDIFKEISIYQSYIPKNPEFKLVINKLLGLLFTLNGTKLNLVNENNNVNNMISIIVKNNYFRNDNNEKKIEVPKNIIISDLKQNIIENVMTPNGNNSIIDTEQFKKNIYQTGIILQSKGKILKDNFKLSDYNLEDNSKIIVFKDDPIFKGGDFNNQIIQNNLLQLKNIFDYIEDEILVEALKKNNGLIEDTILYLTDESQNHVEDIRRELEEKKLTKYDNANKNNNNNSLNFTEEKINLLLSLLDLNDKSINFFIWKLFSDVQFPDSIINIIFTKDYKEIFNEKKKKNQILLLLKLINSIIFKDDYYTLIELDNEKRKDWINDLICNKEIMDIIFKILLTILDKTESNYGIELNILSILIKWLRDIILILVDYTLNEQFKKQLSNINILFEKNKETIFDISNIEVAKIINQILINNDLGNILWILINKLNEKIDNNNEDLIENSFISLFQILILFSGMNLEIINPILKKEYESNIIINLLFICKIKNVRNNVYNFFIYILYILQPIPFEQDSNINAKNSREIVVLHIINNYKKLFSAEVVYYEFFMLLGYIISKSEEYLKDKSLIDFKYLTNYVIESVISLSEVETINEDKLEGYLYLLKFLCHEEMIKESLKENFETHKNNLLETLLDCLFSLNPSNSYKNFLFKYKINSSIRIHSYDLLLSFQKISPIYSKYIINKVMSLFDNFELKENYINEIDIPFREKDDKFIGLRNYGATCYLNSLFQQFFMSPSFNYVLYKFKIEKENSENSVISNMQIAFQSLKESWKKYYTLINFIKSFIFAFNGEPINVKTQQDSDEFLAILCDEIEKEAKKYNMENCLEESFKGKISNEIVSLEKEYPYYSCTDEPFVKITLDIKGHRTLEETLDYFIKEEILEGENKYFVDKYNKKISISKRCSIKKMSNTVIIHLKRFEFDYYTFTNNKLNDYLKFPKEINFKKWTKAYLNTNTKNESKITEEEKENLIENKLDYQLTGILVHSGSTLASGHYYSFIMNQQNGEWYKFDDTKISNFDIKNIEYECFGDEKENNNNNMNMFYNFQKCHNAYLLFYTRKECLNCNKFNTEIKVSEDIINKVKKENEDFLKMKIFVNNDFSNFYLKLIEYEAKNGNKELLKKYENLQKRVKMESEVKDLFETVINSNNLNINQQPKNINEIYDKCKEEIEIRNSNLENEVPEKIKKIESIPQIPQEILSKFQIYYYTNMNDDNK